MSSRLSPPRLAKGSNFKPGTSGRETVLRSKAGLTPVQRESTQPMRRGGEQRWTSSSKLATPEAGLSIPPIRSRGGTLRLA